MLQIEIRPRGGVKMHQILCGGAPPGPSWELTALPCPLVMGRGILKVVLPKIILTMIISINLI